MWEWLKQRCREDQSKGWSFLFQTADPACVAVERGCFCLVLGLAAKYIVDVPILQWIMLAAGTVYIVYGIAYGVTHDDDTDST